MFDKKKYYLKTGAIALSAVLACSVAGGLVYTKNAAAAETSNAGTILTLASTKVLRVALLRALLQRRLMEPFTKRKLSMSCPLQTVPSVKSK